MKRLFSLIPVLGLLLFAYAGQAQSVGRLLGPADILRNGNVGDPQISPDGERVVYTATTVDGNSNVTRLWMARVGENLAFQPTSRLPEQRRENSPRRFFASPLLSPTWNAANPRWSPDGKRIAFLATHENEHGIWVISLDNRVPRFVAAVQDTNFFITYAGEPFAWSPDSRSIAYISATRESSTDQEADNKDDPHVIDRIQYKSRTSLSDSLRTHVWITDVDDSAPRQLTSGPFYDHALSFSPRGDEIAFVSNHELDPDANNNSDIFAVNLHGQVRQITNTSGCEYDPVWSPDGKWIAYMATRRDVTTIDSVAEDTHIWVIGSNGNDKYDLSAALDRRARSPRWSADSKWIFFLANDRGFTRIYRVELERKGAGGSDAIRSFPSDVGTLVKNESGNFIELTVPTAFQVGGFTLSATDYPSFVFSLSDPQHPFEIWAAKFGQRETMRRLSAHNDAFIREFGAIAAENFSFRSFDGTRVEGWLIKPAGWQQDRKYPMILSIHGGPHGMFGWSFNPTFQVYAARGYTVLYLNPRGSSGYGQMFSDGTINEWGGGDYRDLMAGVDEALKRYPWIDANRLGVTGGSYGGFMTNWIITQTPRFKVAVSVASVSNLISFYSTSLYQDLIHAEFGGFPWDNYDLLWQWSPLRYVKQAQTPTMFIHGEQDNDVHITQAEEMYMGLRRRGVDTVFVRYPREGHGLREPRHRVDALERTLAWFDRFLK
jgi:dipeptidyl aminopeptidase/acylaminoacyl peptidase